jgi:hypothetical protein
MSIPNLIPHKTLYISGYIYSYYAFVFIFEFPEHISKHILQFHTSFYIRVVLTAIYKFPFYMLQARDACDMGISIAFEFPVR